MNWYGIVAQGIGILGMGCNVSSFQAKKNFWLFFFQCMGTIFFSINFIMLGSYSAALLNVLAMVRALIILSGDKLHKPYVHVLLQVANVASVVFTYSSWLSLLTLAAQLVQTEAHWTNNGKTIRMAQLFCCSPLWLIHNVAVFSLGGILAEAFVIISTIISFVRFGANGFEKR